MCHAVNFIFFLFPLIASSTMIFPKLLLLFPINFGNLFFIISSLKEFLYFFVDFLFVLAVIKQHVVKSPEVTVSPHSLFTIHLYLCGIEVWQTLGRIRMFVNFYKLDLCTIMWSILENAQLALEKNVYSTLLRMEGQYKSIRPSFSHVRLLCHSWCSA